METALYAPDSGSRRVLSQYLNFIPRLSIQKHLGFSQIEYNFSCHGYEASDSNTVQVGQTRSGFYWCVTEPALRLLSDLTWCFTNISPAINQEIRDYFIEITANCDVNGPSKAKHDTRNLKRLLLEGLQGSRSEEDLENVSAEEYAKWSYLITFILRIFNKVCNCCSSVLKRYQEYIVDNLIIFQYHFFTRLRYWCI
jgi:hypothetical protein